MTPSQSLSALLIALGMGGLFAFSVLLFWIAARRQQPTYIHAVREDDGEYDA